MTATTTNWNALLASWDKQQTAYIEFREERFSLMIQALADHLGERFTFVDLGCGPGSLTQRILDAFPQATAIAVDTDPVLLTMARHFLARFGTRASVVDADMRAPDWTARLPVQQIDAAVSTTAMHWLMPEQLIKAYSDIVALMPAGGMVLNGDHFAFERTAPCAHQLSLADRSRAQKRLLAQPDVLNWESWWQAMEREPALQAAFAERASKQAQADAIYGERHTSTLSNLSLHELALRHAGCSEVATIWQRFENRILMGIKGGLLPAAE